MYSLVSQHLAERNFISDAQWGFTHGKSTITVQLSTFHDILHFFGVWHRCLPHVFDLRKAFDSVPHLPLLNKLKDMELEQHVLPSYLSYRQQYIVVVDSATSKTSPVLSGVLQGSVLGPLLFLIYINCVCLAPLSEGSMISMHADDILLCKPIHHPENYERILMPSMNA